MLPAWLVPALRCKVVEGGKQSELESMCRDWPFFSTRLGMLEMVLANSKADLWLAEYYDQRLWKPETVEAGRRAARTAVCWTSTWCWPSPTIPPDGRPAVDRGVHPAA